MVYKLTFYFRTTVSIDIIFFYIFFPLSYETYTNYFDTILRYILLLQINYVMRSRMRDSSHTWGVECRTFVVQSIE